MDMVNKVKSEQSARSMSTGVRHPSDAAPDGTLLLDILSIGHSYVILGKVTQRIGEKGDD
jgi:hypothetical protein